MLPLALNQVIDYACIEASIGTFCFGLVLTNPDYWLDLDKDLKGFAIPIQIGTIFASAALLVGGIAWIVLMSAICFSLNCRKIRFIQIAFIVASACCLLTMISLATNHCKGIDKCTRDGTHFEIAANMEILATFFYLAAVASLQSYHVFVKSGAALDDSQVGDTHATTEDQPFLTNNKLSVMAAAPDHSHAHPTVKDPAIPTAMQPEVVATVRKLTADSQLGISLKLKSGEVVVKKISEDSPFNMTRLRENMVILRINGQPVDNIDQAVALLNSLVGDVSIVARRRTKYMSSTSPNGEFQV